MVASSIQRYGNHTANKGYQYIPFGIKTEKEGVFGGYTIPTRVSAGWWFGTDRYEEDFRFGIAGAAYH